MTREKLLVKLHSAGNDDETDLPDAEIPVNTDAGTLPHEEASLFPPAYFTIPMHSSQRKYLRFVLQGKTYEFHCLPFGVSSAPWVLTKILHEASCSTAAGDGSADGYINIDDILIMAGSMELAQEQVSALIYLLEYVWLHNPQGQEVSADTSTGHGFSGPDSTVVGCFPPLLTFNLMNIICLEQ